MSNADGIATSPNSEGLGNGAVVGGGVVDDGVGDVTVVGSWFWLSWPAPLADTLQPVRTANSNSDAASVFRLVFKFGMTPLRV